MSRDPLGCVLSAQIVPTESLSIHSDGHPHSNRGYDFLLRVASFPQRGPSHRPPKTCIHRRRRRCFEAQPHVEPAGAIIRTSQDGTIALCSNTATSNI